MTLSLIEAVEVLHRTSIYLKSNIIIIQCIEYIHIFDDIDQVLSRPLNPDYLISRGVLLYILRVSQYTTDEMY